MRQSLILGVLALIPAMLPAWQAPAASTSKRTGFRGG